METWPRSCNNIQMYERSLLKHKNDRINKVTRGLNEKLSEGVRSTIQCISRFMPVGVIDSESVDKVAEVLRLHRGEGFAAVCVPESDTETIKKGQRT